MLESGGDDLFNAYRKIESLIEERRVWQKDYEERIVIAEKNLQDLLKKN